MDEYVKKFGKKQDKNHKDDDDDKDPFNPFNVPSNKRGNTTINNDKDDDDDLDADDESGLCYYSKEEKQFKIFDPRTKKWSGQATKPTEE